MIRRIFLSPQFYLFFVWNVLVSLLYVTERADVNELLVIYWANTAIITIFYIGYLFYRKQYYDNRKNLSALQQKTIEEVNAERVVYTPEYIRREVDKSYTLSINAIGTYIFLLGIYMFFMGKAALKITMQLIDYNIIYISTGVFIAGLVINVIKSNWIQTLNKIPNQAISFIVILRIIPFTVLLIILYKYFVLGWAFVLAKFLIDLALFVILELPYVKKD